MKVFRVFYDRLVDDADRNWLFVVTRDIIKDKMKEDFDDMFIHLDSDNDGKVCLAFVLVYVCILSIDLGEHLIC